MNLLRESFFGLKENSMTINILVVENLNNYRCQIIEVFVKGDKNEADKIIKVNNTRKAKNCEKFIKKLMDAAKDEEDQIYSTSKNENVEYMFDAFYQ